MYSIGMSPDHRPYRCRLCGAASYQRLLHRSPEGAMTYSGIYRCSGCAVDFSDPLEWRDAPVERIPAATSAGY
jgi:hypothetical protein